MKLSLTESNIKFIKANRFEMSGAAMALVIGVNKSVVNRYMNLNGLSVGKELASKFRADAMRGRTTATKKEDQFIKENYLTMPVKTIASKLNRGGTFVIKRLQNLRLEIPREIIEQRKRESQYALGSEPANKGKVMPDHVRVKCAKSWFKKGTVPPNTRERNGVISIRWDHPHRNGKSYKFIRIAVGKWVLYHQYKWEKKNGKIPKGYCIWFKDGDSMNCRLSNLELITRAENMRRNTIHNLPKPLTDIIRLRTSLNRKIKKLSNEK